MRIEGAAGEANVSGRVVAEALHPRAFAAQHTNGQTATQGLAVGHQISLHPEVFLRTARCQPEAQKHFIKNQRDTARGTNRPQLLQPGGIGRMVEMRFTGAVEQIGIAGRGGVGVQSLQRVDQHAGDVAAAAQHAQGALAHFGQREGVARGHGVADAGLHVAPPTVVRATEAYQLVAPAVVSRQAHGLHHRLGARHVKRDLIHAGDALEAHQVIGHHRVVGAEHGAQIAHQGRTLLNAALVKIITQQVHAVRPGQIKEAVTVQIGHRDAFGRRHKGPDLQTLGHQFFELEGHAVGADELQVRQSAHHIGRRVQGFGVAGLELLHQTGKGCSAACHHIGRRTIHAIGLLFFIHVARQQGRYAARCARVAGQAGVFGQGQLHPGTGFVERPQRSTCADAIERQCAQCQVVIHTSSPFLSSISTPCAP